MCIAVAGERSKDWAFKLSPLTLPLFPEGVKKLGQGERRGFTHVQGPEKFACQNDAVISLLPAGESTSVKPEGQFLCIYMVLFQVAGVPSRRAGYPLRIILVPPILARLRRANFSDPWTTRRIFPLQI